MIRDYFGRSLINIAILRNYFLVLYFQDFQREIQSLYKIIAGMPYCYVTVICKVNILKDTF